MRASAGLARCVAVGWPKAVRLLNEGALGGLQAQALPGVTESAKPLRCRTGIANVRRPSPLLAHSPVPHSASFLFPSARRGVKSALFGSSCCGGKKEESKKRGEIPSHLFLSSAQRESKVLRRLWNSTGTRLSQQTIWADERFAVSPDHIRRCRFSRSSAAR